MGSDYWASSSPTPYPGIFILYLNGSVGTTYTAGNNSALGCLFEFPSSYNAYYGFLICAERYFDVHKESWQNPGLFTYHRTSSSSANTAISAK